jgi:mannose-6-phosphate isomerase-like protein (cupin superfamily)
LPTQPFRANMNDLPRKVRAGGTVEETAIVMDSALLKFWWALPGMPPIAGRSVEVGTPDVHPFDQAIFVVSGGLEATLGEGDETQKFEVGAGDILYIPARVPHIGRLLGDEVAYGLDIFAPVRADYVDMAEHQLMRESSS